MAQSVIILIGITLMPILFTVRIAKKIFIAVTAKNYIAMGASSGASNVFTAGALSRSIPNMKMV